MSSKTDVIICGAGSAGLCAGVWLSRLHVPFRILESRSGPLQSGQADGVQCRTVEIFDSFNLAEDLLREAYHVLEDAFWADDGKRGIRRTRQIADTLPGLSHMPHVILNQARVNGLLTEEIGRWGHGVDYGFEIKKVQIEAESAQDPEAHCVKVTTEKDGREEIMYAKYVLGSDGAHSAVRKSLGFKMLGDSTDATWGVMDVYPRTYFPDLRKKTIIHSSAGSLIIIPREGGSLVRFYVELPPGEAPKDVKLEHLQAAARKIFAPYDMEFSETAWWSAYSIGQRLADHFSSFNRVFLMGDACHTHSPKAGQGMNVSMQDGYNIGWKLGAIINKQAAPSLLQTYVLERQKVAHDLIEFDRYWTKLLKTSENGEVSPAHVTEHFVQNQRYTAGLTARYVDSSITSSTTNDAQALAKGLIAGMRFPSTQVIRFCDAKPMQLVKAMPADGRWRIVVFAGDIRDPAVFYRLRDLGTALGDRQLGPLRVINSLSSDTDSVIETILVLSGKRVEIEQEKIPSFFWPVTGKWRMRDLHKTYIDDEGYDLSHGHAYNFYGIDQEKGAIVLVRPDHCISKINSLEDVQGLNVFFSGWALPQAE